MINLTENLTLLLVHHHGHRQQTQTTPFTANELLLSITTISYRLVCAALKEACFTRKS